MQAFARKYAAARPNYNLFKEKFIKIVADFDPREYQRWYDKNPNLHAAVEALRDLDEAQRESLINQISDIVLRHTKEADLS